MRILTLAFVATILFLSISVWSASASAGDAQDNFQNYCAVCHGQRGQGDGELSAALPKKPTNFTDCKVMSKESDMLLYEVIANGTAAMHLTPAMPLWRYSFNEREIWGLVQFIRGFCK